MKIHIFGDWFNDSGYAIHTRQLCNALFNKGVEIAISCNRPTNWTMHVTDSELKMFQTNHLDSDYIMGVTIPTNAYAYINEGKPVIQWVVWEGDKIPKSWIKILSDERIKYIFTPSKHTREAISNTTSDESIINKIRVIPHGVDLSLFKPDTKLKNKEFTFIADKGFPNGTRDRGGLSFLIKAFSEEFTTEEEVKLIIKVNSAYPINSDIMKRNIDELKLENKKLPKIDFIVQNVAFKDLNSLYNRAHVFVIPSLAESFHMGGLQAMACGLPVIANNFGGHTDYVNNENGILLAEGIMKEVDWDLMYEGISWKLPNIAELRKVLRSTYDNKDNLQSLSNKAIETANNFTWSITAEKVLEII